MESNILKIAKRLKTFTLDDIVMFSEYDESEVIRFLENSENIKQSGKYFEYVEIPKTADKFEIIDKNIKPENSEITVIKACKEFLMTKENNTTFQTFKTYKSFINAQIIPYFSKFRLKDIRVADVQDFKIFMQNNKISERRIKNILTFLNQIIKHFQTEGYIERTCVFEVKRLEKIPKREIQVLTPEQIAKLFKIVSKNYQYLEPIIKTMILKNKKLNDILPDTQTKKT